MFGKEGSCVGRGDRETERQRETGVGEGILGNKRGGLYRSQGRSKVSLLNEVICSDISLNLLHWFPLANS